MSVSREVREAVFQRDNWNCRYCGERAIHIDHLVAKALRRRHPEQDFETEDFLVSACGPCNWRRGTARVAPVGFDLSLLPGVKPWRHWDGTPETLWT